MENKKGKRNRIIIAVFLPAIIFLWVIGWGLYWIGHQKEQRKPQTSPSATEENQISLTAIPLEEPIEND